MEKDLLEYEELLEVCGDCFGFGNVTFKRDFGPQIKAGQKFSSVWLHFEKGILEAFEDEEQTKRIEVKFTLMPA